MARFKCERCGWCCRNVNINIAYSDILRWSKDQRLDILAEVSYIDHEDPKNKGFYITKTVTAPKQSCPFLLENNCTIHNTLPRACREFPLAYSEEEKEKIDCPAKDFQLDVDVLFRLKKEQAFDFVIAEDRKEQVIRIIDIAKSVQTGLKILKEFGDDPTETLKVTTMGTEKTGWTEVGTLHLQEQDQPTHYIWTVTKKAEHGDFDFANTAHSGDTFNTCTLYVYSQNSAARDLSAFIWDGTDWTEFAMTHPTTWNWHSIDITLKIDSWTKVDGCKLYIVQPNQADRSDVDAAYLLCDYTGAAGTPVGQVTETDLSQPITWAPKNRLVNQISETDVSQAVGRLKTKLAGQVTETDLAQVMVSVKAKTLGQVNETDLSQAIGRVKSNVMGQVTETDLAQIVTSAKAKTFGQVTEVDFAQVVNWAPKNRLVNQIQETDISQSIAWSPKNRLVGQVTEGDLAQSMSSAKLKAIIQVIETDLAQSIGRIKTLLTDQVTETDLAQSISAGGQKITVNQVNETNLSQVIGRLKTKLVAQVLQTDLAQAISILKAKELGQVVETDLSQPVAWAPKNRLVGQVDETDVSQPVGRIKSIILGQVTELDTAQSVVWAPKNRLIIQVLESDVAQSIAVLTPGGGLKFGVGGLSLIRG